MVRRLSFMIERGCASPLLSIAACAVCGCASGRCAVAVVACITRRARASAHPSSRAPLLLRLQLLTLIVCLACYRASEAVGFPEWLHVRVAQPVFVTSVDVYE